MAPAPLLHQAGHLVDRDATASLRLEVARLLQHGDDVRFPGSQPVALCRRHLPALETTDEYLVYEKTDGVRSLLYLSAPPPGSDPSATPAAYLVGRKNEYLRFKDSMLPASVALSEHECRHAAGTLLDGELVLLADPEAGGSRYGYLVFDCLAVAGRSVTHLAHSLRRDMMRPVVDLLARLTAAGSLQISAKRPLPSSSMVSMLRDVIPKLQHGNDGLILASRSGPYISGTDPTTFKWKPPSENTVDFRLEQQIGQFCPERVRFALSVHMGRGRYRRFGELKVSAAEACAIKAMGLAAQHAIIECFLETSTGRWRPKLDAHGCPLFRMDKTHANHQSVVYEVLESIRDAITVEDLMKVSSNHVKSAPEMSLPPALAAA